MNGITEKKKNIKENTILKKYLIYENILETQALRNSFGKMVSARNITNPKYSFGKEERFPNLKINKSLTTISNDYKGELNLNRPSKNILSEKDNSAYIKYSRSPKWAFSKSERDNNIKTNKYAYYNLTKNYENKNKIWDNHIIGGDIGIEARFPVNKNVNKEADRPGSGGYDPNIELYKYRKNNYGYMGIKTELNKEKGKSEGGNKYYNKNCQIGSNINNYKFSNSPKFIFGTSIRDLQKKNKRSKINERYLKYSAFGEQIMTQKNSRPIYSFGKQERFNKFK
jgi:hypothetical protein